MSKKLVFFLTAIFIISAGLRLAFVRYNREANDDHALVIQTMLNINRLPEKSDCAECYQPKLFHSTVTVAIQSIRLLKGKAIEWAFSRNRITLTAEAINFAAGLATLLVIGLFIARFPVKYDVLKILAFGMVALNPKLIGINSQATNDTFVILFSTLALYCTHLFLQKQKPGTFLLIVLFISLGISSKTNAWVTAIAITLALFVKAWVQKERRAGTALAALGVIVITSIIAIINPLNQYISNSQKYGAPVLLNMDRPPLPAFFTKTPYAHAGVLSIQDGIFTFKFIDLLKHPRIENGDTFRSHRTSLWTQLYGRAFSVHFDNCPATWTTRFQQGFALSRGIYILSLLPTAMLLLGAVMEMVAVLKSIIKRDAQSALNSQYGLMVAVFIGYMLFIILYSILYREYSVMKVIFIYPAFLAFIVFFLRSGNALYDFFSKRAKWMAHILEAWIGISLILYCMDVVTMILLISTRKPA